MVQRFDSGPPGEKEREEPDRRLRGEPLRLGSARQVFYTWSDCAVSAKAGSHALVHRCSTFWDREPRRETISGPRKLILQAT